MIAFDYQGKSYVVDFQRIKRATGVVYQPVDKQIGTEARSVFHEVPVYATYPDTAAVVREMVPEKTSKDWPIRWQATARFCTKDAFTLEAGRVHALRKLTDETPDFPSEAAHALWYAYNGRYRRTVKPTVRDQLRDIVERLERLQKDPRLPADSTTMIALSFRSLRHKLDQLEIVL